VSFDSTGLLVVALIGAYFAGVGTLAGIIAIAATRADNRRRARRRQIPRGVGFTLPEPTHARRRP
jgi:hypothetical protein